MERGVIFDGQDPFNMTSGRNGHLEISEFMHGDWLQDPNTFPVGWCSGQVEVENLVVN